MLQLHLIVIQQPPKESMRRYCKSTLMKDGERYNIPFGRRRLTLVTRYQPLLDGGQWTEKATADEALQTPRGDACPTTPLKRLGIRWAQARWRLQDRRKLDDGYNTNASRSTVAV